MSLRPLEPAGSVPERLRIQAVYCDQLGSPLYGDLLDRAAADVEAGGPTLSILGGHEDDPADSMLALRLMGAVNRLVLLEVGASAGLHLRWDLYRYAAGEFAWGPTGSALTLDFELRGAARPDAAVSVEGASRRGCDAAPVDPATPEGRETLLAYVWPDQKARVERLRAALEVAATAPLAWLRMEPDDELAAVRLTTWPGDEDRLLARAGYHGSPVELAG